MKHAWAVLAVLLLAPCAAAADAGFVPLLDGKSLAGWEGNKDMFRIEEGAIVGGSLKRPIKHNDFLCTTREFGDFELKLQVKLLGDERHANGGIQIRSQRIPHHFEMIGYQADMGQRYWGCLYDESRRKKVLAAPPQADLDKVLKRHDWNDYRIVCQGRRIQLWLNGLQTVDYTEPDATIPQKGFIGLQIHAAPPSEAWYRKLQIRELK